ncbi:MAG: deoxyribodipyrimidine photo-lyase, partial [Halioglobus sp.]
MRSIDNERHLYWFRNDLRLNDNRGLVAHAGANRLLLVYIWPPNRPWCNVTGMGTQRERFLIESLEALKSSLQKLGQDLLVLHGSPELVIPDLVRDYSIDCVGTNLVPGFYERKALEGVRQRLDIPVETHENTTLFDSEDLPFELDELPKTFTP